jgi:hypothetical protein
MNNPTVIFDPYAAADLRNIVQTIVDNHNVASTGRAEWYPVAFFLKDENGEVLGGLLGDIWAAWLHVSALALVAPARIFPANFTQRPGRCTAYEFVDVSVSERIEQCRQGLVARDACELFGCANTHGGGRGLESILRLIAATPV